jgi:hypothetical protein
MKTTLITFMFTLVSVFTLAQSILGNWQLVKQTNCDDHDTKSTALTREKTLPILTFKDSQNGEESIRILTAGKPSNSKNFLYKIDETTLYILNKKTQTIAENFTIDFIHPDSLTLSNVSQPCNSKVFVRIK